MPNRRISKKEQDIHFSKRTGTKKRQKKIKKLNKKEIALQIKNEMEVKRYELRKGNDNMKLIHKAITNKVNDEVIMELNEESLMKQRKNILLLAKILNRMDIPTDLNRIILSYTQSNIYIEPCIFTLLPNDVVDIFHLQVSSQRRKNKILEKYHGNKNFRNFIANVFKLIKRNYLYDDYMGIFFTPYNIINIINNNINDLINNNINDLINNNINLLY